MKQEIIDNISTEYSQMFNWFIEAENMTERRKRSYIIDKQSQARNVLDILDKQYITINRDELNKAISNISNAYENGDNDMVEVYIDKLKDLIKTYE